MRILRENEYLCRKESKSQDTFGQANRSNPRGSKISSLFLKHPIAIQCDPVMLLLSKFTIIKHGDLITILDNSSAAKHPANEL